MSVRMYRRPVYSTHYANEPQGDPSTLPEPVYEDIFVMLEEPLLEFTHDDLAFLRERGIDPFKG